jgi:hypothetical protein
LLRQADGESQDDLLRALRGEAQDLHLPHSVKTKAPGKKPHKPFFFFVPPDGQGSGQAQNPTLVQTTFMSGSNSRDASWMWFRSPQTMPFV